MIFALALFTPAVAVAMFVMVCMIGREVFGRKARDGQRR